MSDAIEPGPEATPRWAEWLVRVLDDGIPIPATSWRVGLDPILGALLPGAGDAVTAVGTISILLLAWRRRVPTPVLARMVGNILLDVVVGFVPVLGDLFDFVWHANRKNLRLLEEHGGEARPASGADYALLAAGIGAVLAAVVVSILASIALFAWLLAKLVGTDAG